MTKPKPRPARAVDAVRQALDDAQRVQPNGMKPVEIVKTAFCAYQAFHYHAGQEAPREESADRLGLRRGTQSSMDRLIFNVNYWLAAYEDRIVAACTPEARGAAGAFDVPKAQEGSCTSGLSVVGETTASDASSDACEAPEVFEATATSGEVDTTGPCDVPDTAAFLRSIAAWNSHTMKLNTLSASETVEVFERFCPPYSENRRRGAAGAGAGKGPVRDFLQAVRGLPETTDAAVRHELDVIADEVAQESRAYERYRVNGASALDALFDLLPAWCLQDRIALVRATWWNDPDVMMLLAERLHDRFLELNFAEPLCAYFLDAMRESVDNYMRTVASDESPHKDTPVPRLLEIVRAARASHPDSEIEGYGADLPAWLDSKEQLVWNTVVCAVYGPMHARPLLAENMGSLPVEGQPASADVMTQLARLAYARYLGIREESGVVPEFDTFESQPDDLRNSGLERIGSIPRMMDVLGYRIVPVTSCYPGQRIEAFQPSEVECLAILEHRRWLAERADAGWTYAAEKDVAAKRSPYLVDWEDLPDRVREWNRSTARDIPALLAKVGLAISK